MSIDRERLTEILAECPAAELAEVLRAAGMRAPADADAEALARRLTRALWWRTHTPVGALAMPDSLDDIVDRVAKRAKLDLGEGDVVTRLVALVGALAPEAEGDAAEVMSAAAAHPASRRLKGGVHWGALVGTSAAGGAAGARWASFSFLRLTKGPIGRILPLLPKVGPVYVALRKGAQVVAKVSGPAGIALSLASINAALGADQDRALPLLLGLGLVLPRAPAFAY